MRSRYSSNHSFDQKYAVAAEFSVAVLFIIALVLFRGTAQKDSSATLTLDWGSQKRTFQGAVVGRMTVLDVLQASAIAGNISLEFSVDDSGAVKIARLDGFRERGDATIEVVVNDRGIDPAMMNTVLVQPRDHIAIKLGETP